MSDSITLVGFEPVPDGSFVVFGSHLKAGYLVKPFVTNRWWFVRSDDYCAPLYAKELREIADKLDELNGVVKERAS